MKKYVNTTYASIAYAALLTFGYIFAALHKDAPFTVFMEGLILGFGVVTGKRLFQTWRGRGKGFDINKP